MSNRSADNEHATDINQRICVRIARDCLADSCHEVRAELIVVLHWLVLDFEDNFVTLALQQRREQVRRLFISCSYDKITLQISSIERTKSLSPPTTVRRAATTATNLHDVSLSSMNRRSSQVFYNGKQKI